MQERALHAGRRPSCALRVMGYDASKASFPMARLHRPAGVIRSMTNSGKMNSCIILLRPSSSRTRATPARNLRFTRPRWALPYMQTTFSRSTTRSTPTALEARWNIQWFSWERVKITRSQQFCGHAQETCSRDFWCFQDDLYQAEPSECSALPWSRLQSLTHPYSPLKNHAVFRINRNPGLSIWLYLNKSFGMKLVYA